MAVPTDLLPPDSNVDVVLVPDSEYQQRLFQLVTALLSQEFDSEVSVKEASFGEGQESAQKRSA